MENAIDRRTFVAGAAVAGATAALTTNSIAASVAKAEEAGEHYGSLQYLLDKDAIEQGLLRYTRSMDRVDWDLVYTIFEPGAYADYGMYYQGPFEGFVEYVHNYHFNNTYCRQHRIFNMTITIDEDGQTASSETYLMVTLREKFVDGKQGLEDMPGVESANKAAGYYQGQLVDTIGYGRYLDKWRKQPDGKWRICERLYNQDFGHQLPITMPVLPIGSQTSDSLEDPSYKFLDNDYLLAQ